MSVLFARWRFGLRLLWQKLFLFLSAAPFQGVMHGNASLQSAISALVP